MGKELVKLGKNLPAEIGSWVDQNRVASLIISIKP